MQVHLAPLEERYKPGCLKVFNQIIEEGLAFPWEKPFDMQAFNKKYPPHEPLWCALNDKDEVLGLFHLHPNNEGRCSHVANCGYSVARQARGQGIGRMLVAKSIEVAREGGFRGIQFNAVVSTNHAAIKLYRSFGFAIIGTVPGGFRQGTASDPHYVDMYVMYLPLET